MLTPGSVILGKYRIDEILGQGGMGIVARAHHLDLDQAVAIKCLKSEMVARQEVVQRFSREAQASVRLKSEHVCHVFDVGRLPGGAPFIVMEFLQGTDLEELMEQHGVHSAGVAVDLVLQACAALAEAHSLGIVHRDIKPANLFVTTGLDGRWLLKVLDFGISKAVSTDSALTQAQAILGTPAYMAPEQIRSSRDAEPRSDMWSLGVVLYELLAGKRPFDGSGFSEVVLKVVAEPLPRPTVPLPDGLAQIVDRCLQKDPQQRYQSVAHLAEALCPYAGDALTATRIAATAYRVLGYERPGAATRSHVSEHSNQRSLSTLRSSAGEALGRPLRERRWIASATGAALAAAAALLLVLVNGDGSREESPQPTALGERVASTAVPADETVPDRERGETVPPAESNEADEADEPSESEEMTFEPDDITFEIRLLSDPMGADVVNADTDEVVGITPYRQTRSTTEAQELVFHLRKSGFEQYTLRLPSGSDIERHVALRPEPRRRSNSPRKRGREGDSRARARPRMQPSEAEDELLGYQ